MPIKYGTNSSTKAAPAPTLRRLPTYHRLLQAMMEDGRLTVSCTVIAQALVLDATQVRKDLAATGIVGKPKVGYFVDELTRSIESFLGWDKLTPAVLAGAGNMGKALLGYDRLAEYGLHIVAAFDADPARIGSPAGKLEILSIDDLADHAERLHVQVGILAVPPGAAQTVANLMVLAGIRAIWNFTPVRLDVPATIVVENVDLTASLAVLSNRLANARAAAS